jgi:DNA invertase Pin-like site-specific DNA recombinase
MDRRRFDQLVERHKEARRMSPRKTKIIDGYVRVSKRGGREGESFISPRLQEEAIRRWARSNGCKIGIIPDPDIDVSGAKAPKDRALGQLIDRVREGKSDGVVVAKLDRFGRDVVQVHEAVKAIQETGGRFVAVDDGIDTNTEGSKFHLGMLALVAEWERDRRRASFAAGVANAIERGVHVGPTPMGYARNGDGRLKPDPDVAVEVLRIFRGRAEGKSWRVLAREFNEAMEQLGRDLRLSHSAVASLVKSKTYRGIVFHGSDELHDAHEAIVPADDWYAAQVPGKAPVHNGTVAAHGALMGVATCASCGRRLKVAASGAQGARQTSYYCRDDGQGCEAPAAIATQKLDEYLTPELMKRLGKKPKLLVAAERKVSYAVRDFEKAEAELEAFIQSGSALDYGEDFPRLIRARREALDQARVRMFDLMDNVEAFDYLPRPDSWDEVPVQQKRRIAAQVLDSVTVAKSTNGRWQPIAERVEVVWR